ncbi:MAG: DUF6005 family protein [Bacilli bacterium]
MIKVHCFVSCVCEHLKQIPSLDHRPFYFGVWDADLDWNEKYGIRYHIPNENHEFFRIWYEQIYGTTLHVWYDNGRSKEENYHKLETLLYNKKGSELLMVMIDLSYLPTRENKFYLESFPHYVLLEKSEDASQFKIHDPDFRWDGTVSIRSFKEAFFAENVSGGILFDVANCQAPTSDMIAAYFRSCMKKDEFPFLSAIEKTIQHHLEIDEDKGELLSKLAQIPVIAIRKFAYEHAFAYFVEKNTCSAAYFHQWTDEVELLVDGLKNVYRFVLKYTISGDITHLSQCRKLLAALYEKEQAIKNELLILFEQWIQME